MKTGTVDVFGQASRQSFPQLWIGYSQRVKTRFLALATHLGFILLRVCIGHPNTSKPSRTEGALACLSSPTCAFRWRFDHAFRRKI